MVRYAGKQVLVTGGTGFVGGRLVERLILEEGASVRVLVKNWSKAVWVSRYRADLSAGDLLDPAALCEAVQGCAVVFHCASGPAANGGYRRTNIEGTRNLLDACKASGVERLVYISSTAVHGPNPLGTLTEEAPYVLLGRDYSDSKVETEKLIFAFGRDHDLPVSVLRPSFIWGPRSHLFTMRQLREMKNGTFRYIDEGSGACNAIYVDNLVDAMLRAGTRPEAVNEAFLITDGLEITWKDFFGQYATLLGIERLPSLSSESAVTVAACRLVDQLRGILDRLQGNPAPFPRKVVRRTVRILLTELEKRYCSYWDMEKYARKERIDISKARRLLGYAPSYGLCEGMRDTLAWVKDQMGWELGLTTHEE